MAALKRRLGRMDGQTSVTLITFFIIQWMGATWSYMKGVNGIWSLKKGETYLTGSHGEFGTLKPFYFSAEAGIRLFCWATMCAFLKKNKTKHNKYKKSIGSVSV